MLRTFSLVATLALAAAAAGAQDHPPQFSSGVHVNNITVDVQVRDANGVPVTGLQRGDFRIFENGKPQDLTNFLAVDGGQVARAGDVSLIGQPAPREVVIFFDWYLNTEADKRPLVATLQEAFADGIPPGMTVAVVTYDGALHVNTPPTASREKLLDALKEVERTPATGLQRQLALTSFVDRPVMTESWGSFSQRRMQTEEFWTEMRRMVGRVETAFNATLARFAGTHARKIAVMVSPGFPRGDALPVYRYYDFWLDRPVEYRNAGLLSDAARTASDLEFTMFTLDASGNQLVANDAATSSSRAFEDVASVAFWREADRKDSLVQAARFTGGDSLFTRDGAAALADVERVTASYYSLAYQPDHYGDGQEYSIEVRVVDHPDYSLAYRTRYVDRPGDVREAERTRAALLTGAAENPLGVTLVLDKPSGRFKLGARGMHVYRIGAELRIPYAQLVMIPRGDTAWGQVQVVVVGVDDAGNQSRLAQQTVPISIPADKLDEARRRGYFAYRFTLELEGGDQSVRVAVNDTLGQTMSTAIADLHL